MTSHWLVPNRTVRRVAVPFRTRSAGSLDRLFDDLWGGVEGRGTVAGAFVPKVNVAETDEAFRLSAELPGLDDEDFEVSFDGDRLTLKGEKKSETREEQKGYSRVERSSGSFERSFRFAWEVDPDTVSATYRNGVLEVVVPKPPAEQSQVRTIPVSTP